MQKSLNYELIPLTYNMHTRIMFCVIVEKPVMKNLRAQ